MLRQANLQWLTYLLTQRQEASNEILTTLNSLKQDGKLKKFGKRLEAGVDRRNKFPQAFLSKRGQGLQHGLA